MSAEGPGTRNVLAKASRNLPDPANKTSLILKKAIASFAQTLENPQYLMRFSSQATKE
jgi:hypothetical protein